MQNKKIDNKEIEKLLSEGKTIKEISIIFNVDRCTISRRIKKYEIKKPEKTKDRRVCWKCKKEKLLTSHWFSADKYDWLGFQKMCKICQKENNKKFKEKNPDYFKEKEKEYYKKENNPERYLKYRDNFLKRRAEFSKTARGKFSDLLSAARSRSKKYNLEFDIDLEFLLKKCEEQNGKCKLTNIDFTFNLKGVQKNFNPFNPSIDRIDSTKGYTKDNIRIVCVIVNLSLNEFGEEIFKKMCQSYINYQLELSNTTLI